MRSASMACRFWQTKSISMQFYKSKSTTISERLTGISNSGGFEAARKIVQSGLLGVNEQKEADSWLRKEWIKRNWWKVTSGIVAVASGVATVWEFYLK